MKLINNILGLIREKQQEGISPKVLIFNQKQYDQFISESTKVYGLTGDDQKKKKSIESVMGLKFISNENQIIKL